MGILRSVSDADEGGCTTTGLSAASDLQCFTLHGAGRLSLEDDANDLPPWYSVQQQAQRWIRAGCFEAMAQDLRKVLRLLAGRHTEPSAVILDGRTLQSTPESGARAGYDGHKRKKGSKVHAAVDTLGHLLALKVTAANEQERAQVADLVEEVQQATGESVEVAFVDQGYTGEEPAEQAAKRGIRLIVVKLEEAKKGFVLLPRRWVVERSFAWAVRFRRSPKTMSGFPPRWQVCTGSRSLS